MLRLRPGPAAVGCAVAAARRFAGEGNAADRLAIITEEWVANVVEHGRAPAETLIVVTFERSGRTLRLVASDAGLPFDPSRAPPAGPNLQRGGGAGLAMIRAWCRVRYSRAHGRNRLDLELV